MMLCTFAFALFLGPSLVSGCGAYGEPCDELDVDFPCCYSENECIGGFCGGCKIGLQYACEDDLSSAPCCYECSSNGHCAPQSDQNEEDEDEEDDDGGDGAVQQSTETTLPEAVTEPSYTEMTTKMIEASETIIRTFYVNGDKKIKKVISVQHDNGNVFEAKRLQENDVGSMVVMDKIEQHAFRLVPVSSLQRDAPTSPIRVQDLRVVRDVGTGKILVLVPVQRLGSQYFEIKELKVEDREKYQQANE